MATRQQGELEIALDRKRVMRMDYNALAEAEEALGRPFPTIDLAGMGVRELRAILYGTLKEDDPSLTVRDAGRLMTGHTAEMMAALTDLIAAAFPPDGGEAPQAGRKKGKG
jgi:hypothetical protein